MASTGAGRGGEVGYKTDDDVRSYVRKRKRANKNCSVSHLRRALNIGYKKAKRIHDEVDDELRRERHDRRERGDEGSRHPSRSNRASHDDDGSDDGGAEFEDDSQHDRQAHDDEQDEGDIPDEALREHIRKKLRRGEVIYVHHMRDLGLSYGRTRRILQEFIDQGKIQKLPKSALVGRSGSEANHTGAGGGAVPMPTADDAVKMKPLKQKVKEENKKAAESQLKTDLDTEDKKDNEGPDAPQQEGGEKRTPPSVTVRTDAEVPSSPSSTPSPSSSSSSPSSSSSFASSATVTLALASATPMGGGAEQPEEVATREAAAPVEPAAQQQAALLEGLADNATAPSAAAASSSGDEQGEVLLVPPASGTAAGGGDVDDMDTDTAHAEAETQPPLHTPPPHLAAQPPNASPPKTEGEGEERKPTILFMEEPQSALLLHHSQPASEPEPSSLVSSVESPMDVVLPPTAVNDHPLRQDDSAHST